SSVHRSAVVCRGRARWYRRRNAAQRHAIAAWDRRVRARARREADPLTMKADRGAPWASVTTTVSAPRVVRQCTASRSEEHTSELQSRFDLVCRLLLEKNK